MINNSHISAEEAFKLTEKDAVLVDIREGFEVENVWMDRDDVLKIPYSEIAKRKRELPENKKLILCCAIGLVSEIAAVQLKTEGYTVYVLQDGLIGWKNANLPLKTIAEINCKCKCCQGE